MKARAVEYAVAKGVLLVAAVGNGFTTGNGLGLGLGGAKRLCNEFDITSRPGEGTRVDVKGVTKGTIPGKPFADGLFKAWIGPKPGPGEGFKKQLLGQGS